MTISDAHARYFHKYLLDNFDLPLRDANEVCHLKVNRLTDKQLFSLGQRVEKKLKDGDDWKWDSVAGSALPKLGKVIREEVSLRYAS